MSEIFSESLSPEQLDEMFRSDEKCLGFLAQIKWANGFTCKKCGNTNSCAGKEPSSRLFIDLHILAGNSWIYLIHLMVLAQWALIIVPFGKWTHFIYRSFAMYMAKLKLQP